jgi:alkanesulfonate monooxygenase SsuD/methylene tetrahydromethanopterin reductase-like flavin-dependent oxidoreductase (luciferase family)
VQQACKQLSREQLAERFSDSAGRAFSLTALEKLWNPGKDVKNLSVGHLPAWVRATGSRRLLEWAAESAGYWLGTPADRRDAELGRRVREAGTALRLIVEQVLREAA